MTTHGHRRNAGYSPEYASWKKARERCANPKAPTFHRYGGRGIQVCDRWSSFENFLTDMGPKPTPRHTLDRINGDGHYEPGNCRWAMPKEQSRNRVDSRRLELDGETDTLAGWAERFGINRHRLWRRLDAGWDLRRALTTPIDISKGQRPADGPGPDRGTFSVKTST